MLKFIIVLPFSINDEFDCARAWNDGLGRSGAAATWIYRRGICNCDELLSIRWLADAYCRASGSFFLVRSAPRVNWFERKCFYYQV
jgi:hypothetical protein